MNYPTKKEEEDFQRMTLMQSLVAVAKVVWCTDGPNVISRGKATPSVWIEKKNFLKTRNDETKILRLSSQ